MENKYQYALVDLSLLLSRNVYACSRGRKIGEYTAADVVRMTIQTLNKLSRDFGITSDKIILLADTWDPEYNGYYRTYLLSGNYKDSRSWMTSEKFQSIQDDPNSTQEEIEKAKFELYQNNVKQEAKQILKTETGKIGLPCFGIPGLEYDDLCYIISSLIFEASLSSYGHTKKSIIVTKDSDCMYCTSPMVDYFRLPVGGSKPEVKTYEEIYESMVPDIIKNTGISLYEYKSMCDALDGGHNDMRKTRQYHTNLDQTIIEILSGDYRNVENLELYQKQYQTFRLETFPMINQAIQEIKEKLPVIGHLGNLEEFHNFCNSFGITGISDKYYDTFIKKFSQKLFTE